MEVTGHAGIHGISIFLVDLGFLENFDFLGFLGGLEILAGGSGAVLVAHPPNHMIRMN